MMRNNVKIAITGGICSGKSTVASIIKEQGYSVVSCDEIYRELLKDGKFIDLLDSEFNNVKNSDGTLNRIKLSEIVFNDDSELKKLNSLTHPIIMQRAMELASDEDIFFCEVPLLFEGGFDSLFDNVIVVLRERQVRVKELMRRGRLDENQAILRLNNQLDYDNYSFAKYYVIHNNGNLTELNDKVLRTVEKIKKYYI